MSNWVYAVTLAGSVMLSGIAGSVAAEDALSLRVTAYKQSVAEAIGDNDALGAFYRNRGFDPIWTGASETEKLRRQALVAAIETATDHGLPAQRYKLDALMAKMSRAKSGRDRGVLEIEMTRTFLTLAQDLQSGMLDPRRIDDGIKRAAPRRDAAALIEAFTTSDPRAFMRDLAPANPEYARLMRAKMTLERQIQRGGWGPKVPATKLTPGQSGAAVVALRNRLQAMGYLSSSLSMKFDPRLMAALQTFQLNHGLEVDGVAGAGTIKELNVSPEERLKSVLVAMERERWLNLPEGLGKRHIKVNLTDFHAQIIDDNKLTFKTRSVIGHQDLDRRTPEFSDVMSHMVINPSWYVPRSIIVNEYLPILQANAGAIQHLEIVDRRGRPANRSKGFGRYNARNFPFSMRQPPGPKNALGTVKFMFPNKYNIYLHDTPAKSLFSREVRTYSHGCVRLNDPHDFAYALLAKQEADPQGYFQGILRTRAERRVNLEQPVPVHLIYRTAFTQPKGHMNYRRDVYGRDAKIWAALSKRGVVLGGGDS